MEKEGSRVMMTIGVNARSHGVRLCDRIRKFTGKKIRCTN